jgi:tetratricopeptide (TPR) repeat protein
MSNTDHFQRVIQHFNAAVQFYKSQRYAEACQAYQAAWDILVFELADVDAHDVTRATVLMNWAVTLNCQQKYAEAADKYRLAWQINGEKLKDREDLEANRATILMNWANTLQLLKNYPKAAEKYSQAWQIRGIKLKDRAELDAARATLLINWASTLQAQQKYPEATNKYNQAWQILGIKLKDREELDTNRATLLMNLALTLRAQKKYSESVEKCSQAWKIWGIKLKDLEELHANRVILLMNWAGTLRVQQKYPEAAEMYSQAWQILGLKLNDREDLEVDRAFLLRNWAVTLQLQQKYSEAADKYSQAWQILGIKLNDREELDEDRATLLSNWAVTLEFQQQYTQAVGKYSQAWNIRGIKLKDRGYLEADRANLLMNWANALYSQQKFTEAADKFSQAWNIWCIKLLGREDLNAERAKLLMNWAVNLNAQQKYSAAIDKFRQTWQIWSIELKDREELETNRAGLLINWAVTLGAMQKYSEAADKYREAWQILGIKLTHRPELDLNLLKLTDNMQQNQLSSHPDELPDVFQAWSLSTSAVMRDRLMRQDFKADVMPELEQRYAQFHLRWMLQALKANQPELLLGILTRVTGWRMTQTLLDEISGNEAISTLPETVQHFALCRKLVEQLAQQLKAEEALAGMNASDLSGAGLNPNRSSTAAPSAEQQAKIHALRAEYDSALTSMKAAAQVASEDPTYAALSANLGFETRDVQSKLGPHQALCTLVDMRTSVASSTRSDLGTNTHDSSNAISGILLVRQDQTQWLPLADLSVGVAHLERYSSQFANRDSASYRRLRAEEVDAVDEVGGDAQTQATGDADAAAIAASAQDGQDYWPHMGQWVTDTLWNGLLPHLSGISDLKLVTMGQAHSLPWEMQTPVGLQVTRYPGLLLSGMPMGLMAQAPSDTGQRLGIAAYQGADLPFAVHEADLVEQLWHDGGGQHVVRPYDYIRPDPAMPVAMVHVIGHGSHAEHKPQAAHLSSGGQTWTLPALLSSAARPRQVMLATCVAGKASELMDGQIYGVTATLMQRGVQCVSGALLPMNDAWMMALGYLTQQHLKTGGSLMPALAAAKEQIRSGAWPAAQIWSSILPQQLASLAATFKTIDEHAFKSKNMRRVDKHKAFETFKQNWQVVLGDASALAQFVQAWLPDTTDSQKQTPVPIPVPNTISYCVSDSELQTLLSALQPHWLATPKEPILGSLVHAVVGFGA